MKHKKIIISFIILFILVISAIGIYHIPEINEWINRCIRMHAIENRLNKKYDDDFTVILFDNENHFFHSENEDLNSKVEYTFFASTGSDDNEYNFIGVADKDLNIIADSYTIYLYNQELTDYLTDMVKAYITDDFYVMPDFNVLHTFT